MAVKLHRCSGMWAKFGGHPCWRVQKALDDSGIEYELVQEGSSFKSSSRRDDREDGPEEFPWIEFEDGSVYREESKDMAETIRAGKLDEKRQTGLATLGRRGAIAQLGERLDRTQEVAGSSPASSIARCASAEVGSRRGRRERALRCVGGYRGLMSPRHPGWKALAEAVAPGARVTRLRRLAGAGMTDAYDVTLDRAPRRVVVKLYRDGDGTAPLEWSRLEFAQRVTAPVPEPIVADLESVWFGRPAVVMSRLPGRPDVTPKDVDSWVGALAQALTQLHETPVGRGRGCAHATSAVRDVARTSGRTRSADRSRSRRRHSTSAFTSVRARLHSRRLPPGQRPLASRPYQWCRRLERSTTRHSMVRARVLQGRGVSTPRTGHRRSPGRRILGHRRRYLRRTRRVRPHVCVQLTALPRGVPRRGPRARPCAQLSIVTRTPR